MDSKNKDVIEAFTAANGRSPTDDEFDALVNFLNELGDTEYKSKDNNIQDKKANGNSNTGNAVVAEKYGNVDVGNKFVGAPRELTLKKTNSCCVISNRFMDKGNAQSPLPWYMLDERMIDETFSWLNFEVEKRQDLSANKIKKWIYDICRADYSGQECFALFLLSHGTETRDILGANSIAINLDEDIIEKLINVKSLQGKPKLIFIQACRGAKEMKVFATNDDIHAAGSNVQTVLKAEKADTFVYYSTTQGNPAFLGSEQGSFFINKLCTVLQQYGQKYHFDDVVTKVNDILSKHVYVVKGDGQDSTLAQVSEACHTLTSKIRFSPLGKFDEFQKNFQYN